MKPRLLLPLLALLLLSCQGRRGGRRVVGVSQCSEDVWREKQNAELRIGAYLREDVDLLFATARDDDRRQVAQIDSLVAAGIDLLIVAPNQVGTIDEAIARTMAKGIPVVVFEHKTKQEHYTAFVSADNREMGREMGRYIARQLPEGGHILVVGGLRGSSPAIERLAGFREALEAHTRLVVDSVLQGDWTEETAYKVTKDYLAHARGREKPAYVFGMNDRSAMGARRAFALYGDPLPAFCGIDGLPGGDGGLRLVRDGLLDASYIYPTRGDEIFSLALDILEGRRFKRNTLLKSALVTRDNAASLLLQSEETERQTAYIASLHTLSEQYLHQLATQRRLTFLTLGVVALLIVVCFLIYMYFLQRAKIRREWLHLGRMRLDFYAEAAHQLRTPITLIEGPLKRLAASPAMAKAETESREMLDIVVRNAHELRCLVDKILTEGDTTKTELGALSADLIKKNEQDADKAISQKPEVPAAASPLLLLVDDNADIRRYLRATLSAAYTIIEAEDGQAGLEMAESEVPDLIVSDVMMPRMNGLEFCKRIKAHELTSHIPVILLTARALSRHQVEGYEVGADAYITKPFEPDVLMACIAGLLRSRAVLKNLWSSTQDASPEPAPARKAQASGGENAFLGRFRAVVDRRLAESELSVEDLAADMHLSRVQLYRKLKATTGLSPVELLRQARLERARTLLERGEKNVSEVAYAVGFSAPSYFSRCYKEAFGHVPSEGRG